jgi:eukaryotic-like serine/threonine-protein kinase
MAMPEASKEIGGKYRYLLELGEGGTANVYLAVAQGRGGFNKLVVMKTLKPSMAEDPEYVRMFLTEARLSARLSHPNIVQTNEVTEDGATPSIVMEYLQGQPLSAIIARGRAQIPLGMHLRIILEVLAGLHYAHELSDYGGTPLSLVHRDVTPHNVFVTYDGQVKLLDFGIAKIATSGSHTETGIIKGKARYMAPEQISGNPPLDRRADIFSVGVTLWEALVGERLWKGQSDITVMHKVLQDQIPAPSSVRPDVNRELDRICKKALSHDRDARYATAAEFEEALESAAISRNGAALISNREIGRFVSGLFADLRAEVKRTVEKQLRNVSSLSWDEYHAKAVHALPITQPSRPTNTGSVSQATTTNLMNPTPSGRSAQSKRLTWLFYMTPGLVAVVAFTLWRLTSPPSPRTAAALQEQASASEAPSTIMLLFEARPPQARLFLDGRALPSNPYSGPVPRGRHVIRMEADGYVPKTENVTLKADAEYSLALEPVKEHNSEYFFGAEPVRGGHGKPAKSSKDQSAKRNVDHADPSSAPSSH